MITKVLFAVFVLAAGNGLPDVTNDADLKKLCRTVVVAPRSDQPQRLLVHIRDWHFVSRDAYAADLRDQNPDVTEEKIDEAFAKSVVASQAVQQEQAAVLRHLIQRYGTKQVFLEGLTDRDAKVFDIIVNALRRTKRREGETWMRIGAAGQLLVDSELVRVLAAEREDVHEAANPVRDGAFKFDDAAIRRRRKAIVERLEREHIAVLVLGAAHDLSEFVAADTIYVQLTVPALAKIEGQQD